MDALLAAWVMTVTDFGTEAQNHAAMLNDLVKDRGSWCHYWRDMELQRNGGIMASGSNAASSALANANVPANVSASLAAQTKLVKSLQGQVDKLRSGAARGSGDGAQPKPEAKAGAAPRGGKGGRGGAGKRRRVFTA